MKLLINAIASLICFAGIVQSTGQIIDIYQSRMNFENQSDFLQALIGQGIVILAVVVFLIVVMIQVNRRIK